MCTVYFHLQSCLIFRLINIVYFYQTMLLVREKEISINDKLLGVSVCGHEFVTPEIHRISIERHGIASGLKKLLMMKQILVVRSR